MQIRSGAVEFVGVGAEGVVFEADFQALFQDIGAGDYLAPLL